MSLTPKPPTVSCVKILVLSVVVTNICWLVPLLGLLPLTAKPPTLPFAVDSVT